MNDTATSARISRLIATPPPICAQPVTARPVVNLHQLSHDQWFVQGDDTQRGGIFNDLKAAKKFIRDDFGDTATVIIKPRFSS